MFVCGQWLQVMARLPLDVRLAKMLLWAVLLRCADPLLTITAALSMRSPFVTPMGRMCGWLVRRRSVAFLRLVIRCSR